MLDFGTAGKLLGWGLRNSVGVAEHPITAGIWSVENSVDEIERLGEDVHQDNPGEELNYHGVLSRTSSSSSSSADAINIQDSPAPSSSNETVDGTAGNYGYPECFAAWDVDALPQNGDLAVGKQFVLDPDGEINDGSCTEGRVSPRLTFQAHMAPLDLLFTPDGSVAYITFHGSWLLVLSLLSLPPSFPFPFSPCSPLPTFPS